MPSTASTQLTLLVRMGGPGPSRMKFAMAFAAMVPALLPSGELRSTCKNALNTPDVNVKSVT